MGNLANIDSAPATALFGSPISVSLGVEHSCVIELDASGYVNGVHCWGSNTKGQLGSSSLFGGDAIYAHNLADDGSTVHLVLLDVQSVSAGGYHTCVLMDSTGFRCWGSNSFGQLGNGGSLPSTVYSPPTADATTDALSVAVGNQFGCVLQGAAHSGNLTCFGQNTVGEKGFHGFVYGYAPYSEYVPPSLSLMYPVMSHVIAFAVGLEHACAYSLAPATLGLVCWGGYNNFGTCLPCESMSSQMCVCTFCYESV